MFKQYGLINRKVTKIKKLLRGILYKPIIRLLEFWFEQGIIINLDKKDNTLLQCHIL